MLAEQLKQYSLQEIEELKKKLVLKPLNSVEELRAWMFLFFDIDFPSGVVYPTSTHGPADAMWRIYELMKTGKSQDIPQVTMLSSRDSFKTLSAAALEVLCFTHFRISIAHAAAVIDQSDKAVQYANSFFRNLRPYLEYHGWQRATDNKKKIEWITDTGESIYLRILVMSVRGMNSEHLPMLFIDEVDIVQDVRALKEAKMVPSIYKQYFPLTVYLSTRKFAGGLMEKTLKETLAAGGEVLKWNILDVTERITPEVAKVKEPKVVRYLSRQLPNENLSPDQWNALPEEKKHNYERFEAYAGISLHPMLPVMRNYLVDRNQNDVGGLYKPLVAVTNNFKQVPPDMGEAQLLCNKPSSSGLVYPRFDNQKNVLSIKEAIERITGETTSIESYEYLKDYLKSLGVTIVGGGDWGYTDYTVLMVIALMAGGEAWVLDTFIQQHLELDDIVKYGKEMQDTWGVDRWYVDQNYPAYLKTLKRKAGMKCPSFKKVVEDGITGLQGKIVDSSNVRRLFVLNTPNNKPVLDAFGEYKWQLDGKGEIIEGKPYHDKDGVADIMDALRYPAQNLFIKGKKPSYTSSGDPKDMKKTQTIEKNKQIVDQVNQNIMKSKVQELVANAGGNQSGVRKKGKIFWG
jgi:hypothetical protein